MNNGRSMFRHLFVLLGLFSLSYPLYAVEVNYDSLRGQNIQTLIEQWGPPDVTVKTRVGDTYYSFSTKHEGVIAAPGSGKKRLFGNPGPVIPAGYTTTALCTIILKVNAAHLVTDAKGRGPQCKGTKDFTKKMATPFK